MNEIQLPLLFRATVDRDYSVYKYEEAENGR